jgi:hypothetical protein
VYLDFGQLRRMLLSSITCFCSTLLLSTLWLWLWRMVGLLGRVSVGAFVLRSSRKQFDRFGPQNFTWTGQFTNLPPGNNPTEPPIFAVLVNLGRPGIDRARNPSSTPQTPTAARWQLRSHTGSYEDLPARVHRGRPSQRSVPPRYVLLENGDLAAFY